MSVVKNGDYYEIVVEDNLDKINFRHESGSENFNREQIDSKEIDPQQAFNKLYSEQGVISMYPVNPAGQGIRETPSEKLNRLKSEIAEFKESMSFMSEQQKEQQKELESGNILSEIEGLEKEIANVASVKEFQDLFQIQGKQFSLDSNVALLKKDVQSQITQNLKQQISDLKIQEQTEKEGDKTGKVEIYLNQEQNKLSDQAKYLDLEKRINTLEEALGKEFIQQEKFANNQTLIKKADYLTNLVSTLDEQKLQEIGKKIDNITSDIEKLNADKNLQSQQNITPSDLKKIHDLNEKVQNIQGIQDELPQLVERLDSLKTIHEESAGFMINLSTLSDLHNKLIQQLGSNDEVLQKVSVNFEQNLKVVEGNLSNLEERLNKVEQK